MSIADCTVEFGSESSFFGGWDAEDKCLPLGIRFRCTSRGLEFLSSIDDLNAVLADPVPEFHDRPLQFVLDLDEWVSIDPTLDRQTQSVLDYLRSEVYGVDVRPHWRAEGVSEPSDDCRALALAIAEELFLTDGFLPTKVTTSRQNGIYMMFVNPRNTKQLGLEIDNELDVVAAVSDDNGVLTSGLFEGDEHDQIMASFCSR